MAKLTFYIFFKRTTPEVRDTSRTYNWRDEMGLSTLGYARNVTQQTSG